MRAQTCVISALCACAGCAGEGTVRLLVEGPAEATLTPLNERLAQITLTAEAEGHPPQLSTRTIRYPSGSFELGEIRILDGVRLSLDGLSVSGQLVGHGRSPGPIDVEAEKVVEVPIRFRRPFAYVAGAPDLKVFDTTVGAGQPYASAVAVASPAAVATSPDGADVVIASGGATAGELRLLSTSTHQPVDAAVAEIAPEVTDLAVSPDSRFAVVGHRTGVTVVNLADLRQGTAQPVFQPLGRVGAVAVTAETAFALIEPVTVDVVRPTSDLCGATSSVAILSLASPERAADQVPLGAPAADLAVSPGGTVVLAMPCRGLVTMSAGGDAGSLHDLLAVPSPSTVAVTRERAWAFGRTEGTDAHLILASVALDGSAPTMIDLPVTEERVRADDYDLSNDEQAAEIRTRASAVTALDLAVLPDGKQVAALVATRYHIQRAGTIDTIVGPVPIVPEMDFTTVEYQLLGVTSGVTTHRMRTSCDGVIRDPGCCVLERFSCTRAAGQDVADPGSEYVPTRLAVLYGDR